MYFALEHFPVCFRTARLREHKPLRVNKRLRRIRFGTASRVQCVWLNAWVTQATRLTKSRGCALGRRVGPERRQMRLRPTIAW